MENYHFDDDTSNKNRGRTNVVLKEIIKSHLIGSNVAMVRRWISVVIVVVQVAKAATTCTGINGKKLDLSQEPGNRTFNDDFCDCIDGLDEPETAACSHIFSTTFRCKNEGLLAKDIQSSHVYDGICDCCDGSDEPRGLCSNQCLDAIELQRKKTKERLDTVTAGYVEREKRLQVLEYKQAETLRELDNEKALRVLIGHFSSVRVNVIRYLGGITRLAGQSPCVQRSRRA
jgi:hypothetical protein